MVLWWGLFEGGLWEWVWSWVLLGFGGGEVFLVCFFVVVVVVFGAFLVGFGVLWFSFYRWACFLWVLGFWVWCLPLFIICLVCRFVLFFPWV